MSNTLPRLDGAFDAVSSHTLDRRQLLRAGAWAAPAVVLATAAPAAAASKVISANSVIALAFSGGSYNPGQLALNNGGIKYDYSAWNLSGADESKGPRTVTVTYTLTLEDRAGNVLFRVGSAPNYLLTATIEAYKNAPLAQSQFSGLPSGRDVRAKMVISTASFSANSLNATFVATGIPLTSYSAYFTIK